MTRALFHRLCSTLETTPGTTNNNPACKILEVSSAAPSLNSPKAQAGSIRSDGNIKAPVPLNISAGYTRTQEMVYPTAVGGLLDEITAGLRSVSEAAQITATNSADTTVTTGTNTITRTASPGWIADEFEAGDVIELTNCVAAVDNGFYLIASINSTTQLTVVNHHTGAAWNTTGVCDVKRGARLINGVTDRSYTLEESWIEAPFNMVVWTGMRVASFGFGFQMGSKQPYSVNYVGRDGIPGTMNSGTASPTPLGLSTGTPTYTDYTESPVFSPTDEITAIIDGAALPLRSLSVTVESGARVRYSTDVDNKPDGIPTGACRVRISIEAYASVLDTLTDARAGTELAVFFAMKDPDGKAVAVSLGKVVFDAGALPTAGMDQDAMIIAAGSASLTPPVDATNEPTWTMRFSRFQ